MRASVPAAALLAALAFPAGAAADATVRAVDVTNTWSPAEVTIKAGEKVDWAFASFPHNVKNKSANWEFASLNLVAPQTASHTFTTPGEYEFLCALHGSTMTGKVIVLNADGQAPAPLPPPPLSEQPLANDIPPLSVFEVRDTVVPKLDRVKVSRAARGVRVRFRLSEAGKVTVKATRGRSVTTRTVEVAKGTRSITVNGLKAGSYRVQVSAKDLAGNAAKSAPRASVTVRR